MEAVVSGNVRHTHRHVRELVLSLAAVIILAGLQMVALWRYDIAPFRRAAAPAQQFVATPRHGANLKSGEDTAAISTPPPIALPRHDYTLPPIKNGSVPVISRIATKERVAFLTIDDGIVTNPNASQLMQASQVKATFFLVYRFIKDNPFFFLHLADETGSDIENHSYDHYILTNLSYDQQKQDICQNADTFKYLYDQRPVIFRPSGGAYNSLTLQAAAACDQKALILWDAAINNGVVNYQNGDHLQPGDIVLMHFRATFQEDLAAFVRAAQASGLKPDLLVDWL